MKGKDLDRVSVTTENEIQVRHDILSSLITDFLTDAKEDVRISPVHISLYLSLVYCLREQMVNPVYIFSRQLMPLAKISGVATYHRTIRELHEYGYIRYVPSYYHLLGSLVYLSEIKKYSNT